jgi:UDP-N-acetylglucosamine kinase
VTAPIPINVAFDQRIVPIVFPGPTTPETNPTLTVVAGQPGAGKSAAVSRLLRAATDAPAVVSAEGLAAFHPDYIEECRWRPIGARSALAPLVAEWLSEALDFAREQRRSIVLEGSFSNAPAVFGTVEGFAQAGFSTGIVVVAARRSESLLTSASRFLEARRRSMPALFTDRESHSRGWVGARALVRETEATRPVGRLTIVSRGGQILFDAKNVEGFVGAAEALAASDSAPVTTLQAAEWFGELRRVTEFARASRDLVPPVADVLVELHQLALNEVLPLMDVRHRSSFYVEQEARLSRELVSLRRAASVDVAVPIAPSPVLVPPAPTLTRGPSL